MSVAKASVILVMILGIVIIGSCEPPVVHELDGAWQLDTTPDITTTNYGNGMFSLSFVTTTGGLEQYTGSGTIGTTLYRFTVQYEPATEGMSIVMYTDAADPVDHYLGFWGTYSPGTESTTGVYMGFGDYAGDSGGLDMYR